MATRQKRAPRTASESDRQAARALTRFLGEQRALRAQADRQALFGRASFLFFAVGAPLVIAAISTQSMRAANAATVAFAALGLLSIVSVFFPGAGAAGARWLRRTPAVLSQWRRNLWVR